MNGIIDSISNLLMPLCSVWIVNKFVNNSFEKKESKKIFTRIIWGLFILIQIVMVIIPGISEPPVRTLRATIPENERHIFR